MVFCGCFRSIVQIFEINACYQKVTLLLALIKESFLYMTYSGGENAY
jgi:hypothetical protein